MLYRSLKMVLLCLTVAGLIWGQGLNTTASKDDWEEINFEFDSSILTDGFPSLLRLAELLNQNPSHKVKLVGHADYKGSNEYNDALGRKRANAVKEFLEKYGARPGQITTESLGETSPKINTRTDEARFMNRRVEMTVTDSGGKIIGAGGVGDAIKALEKLAKQQEECCNAILKKLDKLDDILAAINDLKGENAKLRDEIDKLKSAQTGLQREVAEVPKTPAPTKEELAEVAQKAAEAVRKSSEFEHFSIMGLNVGTDDAGNVTWTGKGRFFKPFKDRFAVQAEAEYLGWSGRKEGQFDIGLVARPKSSFQFGLFSSFKHVSLSEYDQGGTLGQAAVTADYIFGRGKVGVFGAKGFMENALIQTRRVGANIFDNTYLRTVDQIGVSGAVGLWGKSWAEGNMGFLYGRQAASRTGGTMRLVMPFRDHWAFTAEGGVNETLLSRDTYGRWALGVRFGNFLSPQSYSEVEHPVPVDIPRVRYEIVTERIRSGNDAPIADAGPDLIGVPAGQITLDGSGSSDPDGDEITYQWSQLSGPSAVINSADQARATFTAQDGKVYSFRLTVTDELGAASSDTVAITTKETPRARILQFTATPNRINNGESSTLNWQVENADEVVIDNGVGPVDASSGTAKVMPAESTIYTLTAKNSVGEVTQTVLVTVETPMPSFVRCDVTPQNVVEGGTASIAWQTENADQVALSGYGNVSKSGSQTVNPVSDTTYTLTATNENGTVSCPLTVQVTPGNVPQIVRFTASPTEILAGTSSSLFWQVENADEVTIDNGVGDVSPKNGSTNVSPTATMAYTLTARNRFGEVSSIVVVTVVQEAKVVLFEAVPNPIEESGDLFMLRWVTENTDEVIINPNLGPRPSTGSVPIRVTEATTYTIIARNKFSEASATVTVTIKPPDDETPTSQPPVARTGPDRQVFIRDVRLDGTASSDPEGKPLTYFWRSTRGTASISNPTSPTPDVILDGLSEFYTFELTVTDETGGISTDSVTLHFRPTTLFE